MRVITPPFPAASRPSKMTTTFSPAGFDPFLEFDQFDLEPEQFTNCRRGPSS